MIPISTPYRREGDKAPPWRVASLLLVCYCLSTQLLAQVQSGQFHLGGQVSFDNYHSSGQRSFSATLQPELGVMLSPKWSAGLGLPIQFKASSFFQNYYRLGISPFLRRYFDLKQGFYSIVHLQAGIQFDLAGVYTKETVWTAQITPEISYFFSPRFAFEAGFGGFAYTRNQSYPAGREPSFFSNSKLSFQTNPIFSLRYYFPRGKSN